MVWRCRHQLVRLFKTSSGNPIAVACSAVGALSAPTYIQYSCVIIEIGTGPSWRRLFLFTSTLRSTLSAGTMMTVILMWFLRSIACSVHRTRWVSKITLVLVVTLLKAPYLYYSWKLKTYSNRAWLRGRKCLVLNRSIQHRNDLGIESPSGGFLRIVYVLTRTSPIRSHFFH